MGIRFNCSNNLEVKNEFEYNGNSQYIGSEIEKFCCSSIWNLGFHPGISVNVSSFFRKSRS